MQAMVLLLVLIFALMGLLIPSRSPKGSLDEAIENSYNQGVREGTARGIMFVQQIAFEKGMGKFVEAVDGRKRFVWNCDGELGRVNLQVSPELLEKTKLPPSSL